MLERVNYFLLPLEKENTASLTALFCGKAQAQFLLCKNFIFLNFWPPKLEVRLICEWVWAYDIYIEISCSLSIPRRSCKNNLITTI